LVADDFHDSDVLVASDSNVHLEGLEVILHDQDSALNALLLEFLGNYLVVLVLELDDVVEARFADQDDIVALLIKNSLQVVEVEV